MDIQRLVHMANDIARFYHAEPDREEAVNGVLTHIQRFWDPRMRRELLLFVDEHGGEGLHDSALSAIRQNREKLTPHD